MDSIRPVSVESKRPFDEPTRVERFVNRLSDMDHGWWPALAMRPRRDQFITDGLILKLMPIFCAPGAAFFMLAYWSLSPVIEPLIVAMVVGGMMVAFFLTFRFSSAHFWNKRAERIQAGWIDRGTENATTAIRQ